MLLPTQTERRHFTADEVERMVDVGILSEDEPLELLEGELVVVTPQNPLHAALTERIRRLVEKAHGRGAHARTHSPLAAGLASLPEPDVGLYRGEVEDYLDHHPTGHDALLVVEIATTSRLVDRAKARIYALAGVPVYWLVDVPNRRVEVRTEPRETGEYALTQVLEPPQQLEVPGSGTAIAVASLLP
jgi:Uma2 family endonuclease